MTEGIIIALITGGLGLMAALLRAFMLFRREDLDSHDQLTEHITEVAKENSEAHREVMEKVDGMHADLRTHRAVTEERLANIDKAVDGMKTTGDEREGEWQRHSRTLAERLGRIEGKLEP